MVRAGWYLEASTKGVFILLLLLSSRKDCRGVLYNHGDDTLLLFLFLKSKNLSREAAFFFVSLRENLFNVSPRIPPVTKVPGPWRRTLNERLRTSPELILGSYHVCTVIVTPLHALGMKKERFSIRRYSVASIFTVRTYE